MGGSDANLEVYILSFLCVLHFISLRSLKEMSFLDNYHFRELFAGSNSRWYWGLCTSHLKIADATRCIDSSGSYL